MEYQLKSFTVKGLILDDVKKEIRIVVDIIVITPNQDERFEVNNSNVELFVKGFGGYDELSAQIKEASANWVSENYPSK